MAKRDEKPTEPREEREPLGPDTTSEELMAKVYEDPPTGGPAIYPAGTTVTTADGREIPVEELGFETHSKPDSSKKRGPVRRK